MPLCQNESLCETIQIDEKKIVLWPAVHFHANDTPFRKISFACGFETDAQNDSEMAYSHYYL